MGEISTVGVVGCGLMGSGIAEVCARAGLDVLVGELDAEAARAGKARVTASLDRGVRSRKLSAADRDTALARLAFTDDLADFAELPLVVEAVAERLDVKSGILTALDKVLLDPDAIIASNTSSIPVIELAALTARPDHVVGVHFFNPVPVQQLVEIVPTQLTADDVVERVTTLVTDGLGKTAIRARDRSGFVVNALLVPYLISTVRMLESGFASAEDIDKGMVLGCAHPMGPLRLLDLIGLDTVQAIAESMYEEFKEPLYAPPPLLRRMVAAGTLGRKTGRGFYRYDG
ncbi:3-hydroxybutyryl-CoA dehydrogenase [Streptomyces cavernicola]|uniref:3-hydroxybutyryl-CoA dehydrogenase n=1 Tax=Streptomyces cavernicola TaxID=3043613 RepID=A0ABT6SFC2_9ACTN|nr:3-hydroxybutyryl-CoA dehydrogenase [Streptomyces sp. B-S-A6]MDI3406902.1 3-hydroxybutyryl-CoA dehydrogenase [Streptomyces sp. B-S-A6]